MSLAALARIGPAAVYTIALFVAGSIRVVQRGARVDDKVLHVVAFGLMFALLMPAVRYVLARRSHVQQMVVALVTSIALGGLLEIWQLFLAHRQAELGDFIADAMGAGLACVAYWMSIVRARSASTA